MAFLQRKGGKPGKVFCRHLLNAYPCTFQRTNHALSVLCDFSYLAQMYEFLYTYRTGKQRI